MLRQECTISGQTGAIRMTLWEEAIDKDARVRTYMGQKYLTVSTDTFFCLLIVRISVTL